MAAPALKNSYAISEGMSDKTDWQDHCQSMAWSVLDWAFSLPAHRMWVSGAGTCNVLAGALARHTGMSFDQAHAALDQVGGPDWRDALWTRNHLNDGDGVDAAGVDKFLTRQGRRDGGAV